MIEKLNFKFGSFNANSSLELEVTPITIFVGPNNSGKSKALIEIENFCRTGIVNSNNLILDEILYSTNKREEFLNELKKIEIEPNRNEEINSEQTILSKLSPQTNEVKRFKINKDHLIDEATSKNASITKYSTSLYSRYVDIFTIRLDGTNRLNLLSEKNAGDLQKTPNSNLSQLFQRDDLRLQLRNIIYEAFNKYFVIDPTNIGKLRVRLSDEAPRNNEVERGWGDESVAFHKKALPINDTSDGVKAFCGILSTIIAGDPKVMLIDEPEAFLHPSLSNLLGKEIGKSLNNSNKRLFASTHSSSFLMGCIQSNSPLNIVRLTYKNNNSTARVLPKEKIIHLMRNPLLRSTGVLSGLFYDAVVVTEADSDRAFYQEINERLLYKNDYRGTQNCLFLNAQNKQTVWDIVKPLRELGIPTLGIVDIDVFKEGGRVFTKLLEGAFVPELQHNSYHIQRKAIYDALNLADKNWKRNGGIAVLNEDDEQASKHFINQLKEFGVFIVKNGELESWLKYLNIEKNKSTWLQNTFIKMGEDPQNDKYLNPIKGDVWDFIGDINNWLTKEDRLGIPK